MGKCVVKSCVSRSDKHDKASGVTFHRVPKDQKRKEEWIRCIRLLRKETDWLPSTATQICSKHFRDQDKIPPKNDKGHTKLSNKAVPMVIVSLQPQSPAPSTSAAPAPLAADSDPDPDSDGLITDEEDAQATPPVHRAKPAATGAGQHAQTPTSHEDISCNECGGEVVGFRYTCVECLDFDLCASCEAGGAHAQHYVLRIPRPRPHMEIVKLVRKIRSELESGVILSQIDTESADPNEESIKIEIQVDFDIEPDPLQESELEIKSEPPESPDESAVQPSSSTSNIHQMALLDAGIKKTDEPANTPKKRPAPQTPNKPAPKKAKETQVLPNRKVVEVRSYSGPSSADSPLVALPSTPLEAPRSTAGFVSEVFTHRAKDKPPETVEKRTL